MGARRCEMIALRLIIQRLGLRQRLAFIMIPSRTPRALRRARRSLLL